MRTEEQRKAAHTRANREWRRRNLEKCREYDRRNYLKNREKKLAYQREYCIKHRKTKTDRRKLVFSGVLQIDGITFGKDQKYDEYMKRAKEADISTPDGRILINKLVKRAARYLRVVKMKPLEDEPFI